MQPLAVIGNVNVDLIMGTVPAWPKAGTEVLLDHDELRAGGSAGNTSLAWTGLGIPHQIAATVGTDEFGHWLAGVFRERSMRWPRISGNTTTSVGITHPDGERTFFTTQGHLPHMSLNDVLASLDWGTLKGGTALLCGSFLTGKLTGDYDRFFRLARSHDVGIALDTGWPVDGWTEETRERTLHWLAQCDYALLSENEVIGLARTPDVEAAARTLHRAMKPGGTLVTKLGPQGALAVRGTDLIRVPAPVVEVVDTIGAGDVFNAGFLTGIARSAPVEECLSAGISLASNAISTQPRSYAYELEQKEPVP
ncbi:carbohydrate kinase family protein [Nitratireductor pacificus]|uniref:Sugar kinase n=1 Tax=Nitratireductor pacificus pht-3B TaxID=391937 RepID=K2LKN3_9HYPH|nr:PfkB family carbohydrate kinase [Nitratireductor pacificus]EKF18309.1 sugar kinase [Nitratireductor pacificus pht-3B]